jgi:hypothetical protein
MRRGKRPAEYDQPLPLDLAAATGSVEKQRKRYVKPKGYGKCPGCLAARIALIQQGKHWVWKAHTYRTYSGASLACVSSGIRLCDLPEGSPTINSDPIHCSCWSAVA